MKATYCTIIAEGWGSFVIVDSNSFSCHIVNSALDEFGPTISVGGDPESANNPWMTQKLFDLPGIPINGELVELVNSISNRMRYQYANRYSFQLMRV